MESDTVVPPTLRVITVVMGLSKLTAPRGPGGYGRLRGTASSVTAPESTCRCGDPLLGARLGSGRWGPTTCGPGHLLTAVSKRGKTRGGEKPIDAQALRKKVSSVTCGPAARAILSSLLLYVTDLQDRPPGPPPAGRAEGVQGKAGRSAESQDAHRRPTCFQLLQAKFMGTGREPRLKKAREVGRLISKDKQGPSRSLVTATINKLLEKAREGAGRPARDREPPPSQKPRQGLPAGKGTVKNILKLFLAAEEKAVCEQPAAARGPPPKPAKRGSVLSKLREKFERSGCLCSEAGVLPLRPERRKESLARRRMHRPETRVLRTATLASTCIGTPLARFLACTAEPVLAFSIATVVCGPRSWLSHCTKISHARHSREPRGAAGVFPGVGRAGDRRGQPDGGPAQLPVPWATAPGDSREMALPGEGPKPMPGPAPSPASHRAGALAGREPEPSPRKPAGPGRARAAGGARTGDSPAGDAAQHTMAPSEAGPGLWPGLPGTGAGRAPEVALTVCSSEDETEGVSLGSEGDPLFAVQETFPEQKVAAHIPPLLVPAVQALRGAQSAPESLHVTVTWPDTYQMPPAPTTLPKATESPQVTVPQLDSYPVPPAPATLPKATESPRVTVPRPDTYPVPPAPATLPKATESPRVTVPRPDTYPVPPAPATLPKATESPRVTVPRLDSYPVPPAPATLPKATESPRVTVPRLDSYPVPPAPAMLSKATESPQVTVPRLDSYSMPPAPAMLPKAMESPQVTIPQPDTYPVPPAPATLPKATESPWVTVPRLDSYPVPPAPATLPKATESPRVTVPQLDSYPVPPAPATLPKATESPQVTVPQLDSYPVPPAPATLPKATESPRVTVPRLDSYSVPPAPAMLPKAMESPQVTVPQPDTYPVPPAPATLPKATESPQVTVPQPDTYLVPPAPTTLPKASGARDRGSSLLSSGGGGRGGLESTRVPFPTGTGGENTRAVSTVEGPLKALSVPPARGATSTGQDLPMAALQQRPACRMANSLGFEDSKELWHPEGLAGGDASELACEKLQGPASGDRPVRGGDAPWHHLTASGNRQTGDSPSGPGRQRELPAQAGHPVGVSAVPGVTPSNRTRSDSPTAADEGVQCGRELGGPPRRASAQPGVQAARGTSPGLGGHRPTPLSGRPPGAPRRAAATGATESHTAPVARDIPKPVNSTAGERNPVHDGGGRPPPTHPSLAAAALAGASDPPHGSTRAGPREHLLESNACGGSGQRWLETPESLAAAPLRAAGTPLGPRVSVTAKSKADTVAAGRGAPAVHGSPRGEDMTRVPRGAPPTPRGGAAVGPPPSENQQAEEDKRVLPKLQVPPGAGAPRQPPAPGAPGGQWVCGAPQKGPDPQAHPPSASLTRAGVQDGVEVGDRRPPQAGLGALVEGAAGPVRPDGALDKGVALCGQKSRSCAAKAGQTRPGEVEVGHGAEVGATEVGTGHQCTEKGPEHARGQQARRAENPPRGHSAPAGENQAPSPLEKPGRPAQPQAGRRAPCSSAGPANSSSEAVPTVGASGGSRGPAPRGSQAEHGAPHQGGESQPAVGRSPRSPSPEPGGWEMPCAAAQEGPPNTPQAESSVLERGHHRRRAQFAKYRAQSFGDQRSFDLSFRPTVIRANDTFELPK